MHHFLFNYFLFIPKRQPEKADINAAGIIRYACQDKVWVLKLIKSKNSVITITIATIIPVISFLLLAFMLTTTAEMNTDIAEEKITKDCKTEIDKTFFIATKEKADNPAKNTTRARKYENINNIDMLNSFLDLIFFLVTTFILGIKKIPPYLLKDMKGI